MTKFTEVKNAKPPSETGVRKRGSPVWLEPRPAGAEDYKWWKLRPDWGRQWGMGTSCGRVT